jgi:branched-chain amino acid transport system substrate-binding protein
MARRSTRSAVFLTASLVCSAACGTRVPHDQVVAGAGGGVVSLSPDTIRQLRVDRPATITTASVPAITSTQTTASGGASAPAVRRPNLGRPARGAAGLGRPFAPALLGHKDPQPVGATAPAVAAVHPNPSTTARCERSLDPVAIGQVGTFSGVAGPVIAPTRTALAAWAQDITTRGGLACHPVAVYSADDAADPARAAADVQELVADHHIVALVGNLVAGSINGFAPAVAAAKIPAIGGGSYTMQDFENRWFFPEGASVQDQVIGVLRDGVEQGHKRLGALYCVEAAVCTQADEFFKSGAKQAGAEAVYDAPVSITQPDFTAQCLNARDAKVDLLGLALDGASIGRVARSCALIGYHPVIAASAAVFGADQAADPVIRSLGVATITTEAPWFLDDQPGLRAFHQGMAEYAPNVPPTGAALIAWASAELLRTAVDKVSDQARNGPITTELLMTGLGRIHDDTLGGLTGPLTFTPDEAHATSNGCVFYELLNDKGWSAPRGSNRVCLRH